MTYDDITLMAHADGELDPAAMREIDAAAARDPALAARIAAFRDSRLAVHAALARPEPVPAALESRVAALIAAARATEAGATNVTALAPRRRSLAALPLWQGAIAASLLVAVGLAAGVMLPRGGAGGLEVAVLADPGLGAALASVPAGERQVLPSGGTLAPIATFLTEAGELCREFEYDARSGATVVSVACRDGSDWDVRLAIAAAAETGGYAPASSLETLDAWLDSTGAGAPMSAADEAAALRAAD